MCDRDQAAGGAGPWIRARWATAQRQGQNGCDEPLHIRLQCGQVLQTVDDACAAGVLTTHWRELMLMQRAERIGDVQRRKMFQQAVPFHRQIELAWRAAQK